MMPRINARRVLLSLCVAAGLAVATPAAASGLRHGLLWKVSGHGAATPSWLFGTIHSSDPRVTRLTPKLRRIFDHSSSYSMELIFNGTGFVDMAQAMYLPDGQTLKSLIGPNLYERIHTTLTSLGLPTDDLDHKKPWAVILSLGTPHRSQGLFLDLMLQVRATLQMKPTYGLETMAEQIAVFNDMPMADQIALLRDSLRTREGSGQEMADLMQAYLHHNLGKLYAISQRMRSHSGRSYAELMDRMLVQRNRRMLNRIQPRLREGNAFIAVGALHLAGPNGLVALLRHQGYRVQAVN